MDARILKLLEKIKADLNRMPPEKKAETVAKIKEALDAA